MKKFLFSGLSLLLSLSHIVHAGDIASDVRAGQNSVDENGGFFELGASAGYYSNPRILSSDDYDDGFVAGLIMSGDYRYNGFFIEADHNTSDGLNLGYTLANIDNWTIDLLAGSVIGKVDTEFTDEFEKKEFPTDEEKLEYLDERDTLFAGAGIRLTGYFNNFVMQYRLVTDIYESNGVVSTIRFGRNWQYRNWNYHGIFSLEYTSEKTNNYWYGISQDEAVLQYTPYEAKDSFNVSAEVGVSYPINENWVYRSFARYKWLDSTISNSPLIDDDYEFVVINSITYVF
ncbi:MipA/OmpV family protein [Catenovulum sp. SM1970]|uniref:MipA/OmpV family protein n=1 Tax=Marinifaba aquimaris TaxID=2741323 RepID=UPI001574A0C2|nr:MipA/OmpV family protein [Marinifaba aquimaris]NTS76077.1 MipA/OmpV family protein [Marinifaba aquimaris]